MRQGISKIGGRSLGVLGLALLALNLAPAGAGAESSYLALQCYPGVGGADHSSAQFSGPARKLAREAACSDRGLGVHSPRRSKRGLRGEWSIAAPNGTNFASVSLQGQQLGAKGWRPSLELVEGGADSVPFDLPADGDWRSISKHGSFKAVVAELACAKRKAGKSANRKRRRAARWCRRTKRPFVYARRFEFMVADQAAPEVSALGGAMFAGGIRSGNQTASMTASDKGGGLRTVFLRVNGATIAGRNLNCDLARMGQKTVAEKLRPCPGSGTEALVANTSVLPFRPGSNTVQACASDYSDEGANVTCSAPRTLVANGGCDRVASTSGSDTAAGTVLAPYRSAQKLADSLAPGQRGCFRAGTYSTNTVIDVTRPGITLTSLPGERATLRGELKIEPGANGVTIRDLNIDGRSPFNIGPMVFASNTLFDGVDVTNYNTGVCFMIGSADPADPFASNTVIQNSRIHHCGELPSRNQNHGIYVQRSFNAVFRDNFIYDNVDRGIQLFPHAYGTQIYRNVIDGNGEGIIFSGNGTGYPSSNNVVHHNVISNSKIRWNVESFWTNGALGVGNVVRDNCLWATNADAQYRPRGGIQAPSGFSAINNVVADPRFVSRVWKDFRLQAGSPCAFVYG